MSSEQIAGHLQLFAELGVAGFRRDGIWRIRTEVRPAGGDLAAPAVAGDTTPASAAPGSTMPAAEPASALSGLDEVVPLFATAGEALAHLREDIGHDCQRCKLHTLGRRQVVFGVGNPDADLMFVGEAPGADEDLQGEPFVGAAGQLLTKIIEAIGLTREQVYIANVIKCRPPGNRNPEPDEVDQCEPFLFRQIDAIKPKVIVALGKFAAQSLLRTADPISRLRGREYPYRDAILMPTFHPAYLLRNPSSKREVWEDMKRVRQILGNAAR
jgi:DNA polymerase